eukprot:g24332.t1
MIQLPVLVLLISCAYAGSKAHKYVESPDELFQIALHNEDFDEARKQLGLALLTAQGREMFNEAVPDILREVMAFGAATVLDDVLAALTAQGELPAPADSPMMWQLDEALASALQMRDMGDEAHRPSWLACIEVLLRFGAKPLAKLHKFHNALIVAVKSRDLEAAKLLVSAEACFDLPTDDKNPNIGWTAIRFAADSSFWRLQISRHLLKMSKVARKQAESEGKDFWQTLRSILSQDDRLRRWGIPMAANMSDWTLEEAQAAFEPMPENRADLTGTVVSRMAFDKVDRGTTHLVASVLEACAQAAGLQARPSEGFSEVQAAMDKGVTQVRSTTPRPSLLAEVTAQANLPLLRALLEEYKFNPNTPSTTTTETKGRRLNSASGKYGLSALHFARALGLSEAVELLLAHGANSSATDAFGRTPMELGTWLSPDGQQDKDSTCDVLVLSGEQLAPYLQASAAQDGLTPDQRFARDFMSINRPVMLKGAAKAYHAFQQWSTPEYFISDTLGKINVSVGAIPYSSSYGGEWQGKMSVKQYVQENMVEADRPGAWRACPALDASTMIRPQKAVCADAAPVDASQECKGPASIAKEWLNARNFATYIFDSKVLSNKHSALNSGLGSPPGFGNPPKANRQFMMGPAGSGSPLHFHNAAWNMLLVGRKYWTLYPAQVALMSAGPRDISVLDTTADALTKPLHCYQEAGDIIFVPTSYVHSVVNMCDSVGAAVEKKGQ